jgi:DNA invertase Pin-like site-specific DNA recombinase
VQLHAEGCAKIYRETASGARPHRRELLKMPRALAPSDLVTVKRIDRLTRSTLDLFTIVKPDNGRDRTVQITSGAVD